MGDLKFRQVALNKLDMIYSIKDSMDKWLEFWAEEKCHVQVGDNYNVWVDHNTYQAMVVSKVSAKLVPSRRFVWWVEGWVTLENGNKELYQDTFEMEEDDEI